MICKRRGSEWLAVCGEATSKNDVDVISPRRRRQRAQARAARQQLISRPDVPGEPLSMHTTTPVVVLGFLRPLLSTSAGVPGLGGWHQLATAHVAHPAAARIRPY